MTFEDGHLRTYTFCQLFFNQHGFMPIRVSPHMVPFEDKGAHLATFGPFGIGALKFATFGLSGALI